MKTPTEIAQIKAEALREAADDYVSEKTAIYREVNPKWHDGRINNWLRERADALVTPPVELPTEPTLGIVTVGNSYGKSGNAVGATVDGDSVRDSLTGEYYSRSVITAFTPAVAVPKAALDELRRQAKSMMTTSPTHVFLAAVDEANGDRA